MLLAIIEINIEGPNGWAKNLPTWRPSPNKWYVKVFKKILNNKEMTGYHLSLFSFLFLMFHLQFFFGLEWRMSIELDIIAMFLLFAICWDYLWFVLNPHFSIKNFKVQFEFWHQKWMLGFPKEFPIAAISSFILAFINYKLYNAEYLTEWIIVFVGLIILTALARILIKTFKPEWE